MIITPHVLTGAAVGAQTSNLALAFLFGLITHFILDALPHFDPGTFEDIPPGKWPLWFYLFVGVDLIIGWGIIILFFRQRPEFWSMAVGGLGAMIIDAADNIPIKNLYEKPFFKQLHWLHHHAHYYIQAKNWYWGFIIELIVAGGALWYLFIKF